MGGGAEAIIERKNFERGPFQALEWQHVCVFTEGKPLKNLYQQAKFNIVQQKDEKNALCEDLNV